jgi:hypothetical protein
MVQSGYLGWVVPRAAAHRREAEAYISTLLSPATARFLLQHGVVPAGDPQEYGSRAARPTSSFTQAYLQAILTSKAGVYLDAAPIANLNATMEANVQLLLQGYEGSDFIAKSLEQVYRSRGKGGSTARIDGEF